MEAQRKSNQQAGAFQLQLIACLHCCCSVLQADIHNDLIRAPTATCCDAQHIYHTSSASSMVVMACMHIFQLAGNLCIHGWCFTASFAAAVTAAAVASALAAVRCAL